mgnify:CR=1 FL=1
MSELEVVGFYHRLNRCNDLFNKLFRDKFFPEYEFKTGRPFVRNEYRGSGGLFTNEDEIRISMLIISDYEGYNLITTTLTVMHIQLKKFMETNNLLILHCMFAQIEKVCTNLFAKCTETFTKLIITSTNKRRTCFYFVTVKQINFPETSRK